MYKQVYKKNSIPSTWTAFSKSFMDTVTLMIVDIVGVLAQQSEEAQSWQKITVKELKPSMQMFERNHCPRREISNL